MFTHAPPPAYSPKRDTTYQTEGAEIARVAKALGITLMPWQRHVADIATEYRLDDNGRRIYKYGKVLVTVPRQSGKTTLMTPVRLHRILTRPAIDAFSTAQTGKDARARILKMVDQVEASPLSALFKTLRSNGQEGLAVPGNRSKLMRFSPVNGALHGETPYFVDFDEIWKYSEQLGDALLGGASPAQITLGGAAQIWMISTKGTKASEFMNKYVRAGENGTDPDLAYFAWQMPAGLDPDDSATWWTFHPALGNTISEKDLRKEMFSDGMTKSERLRAYMNILTEHDGTLIDPEIWDSLEALPETVPPLADVSIGVEVAPESAAAAVVAAWQDSDGRPVIRVLHRAPGATWLTAYLQTLHEEHGVTRFVMDGAGPIRRFSQLYESEDSEITVRTLPLQDRSTADLNLIAAARDERTLKHDGSKVLTQEIAAAQVKIYNGMERIDRDKSLGPVCSLIAASVALYDATNPTGPAGDKIQIFA